MHVLLKRYRGMKFLTPPLFAVNEVVFLAVPGQRNMQLCARVSIQIYLPGLVKKDVERSDKSARDDLRHWPQNEAPTQRGAKHRYVGFPHDCLSGCLLLLSSGY